LELGKWAMIDTDMDGNYATGLDGTPLSLREIREHYIAGEKIQYHPEFKSRPNRAHTLFREFIRAAGKQGE
jgi:CTP synthase